MYTIESIKLLVFTLFVGLLVNVQALPIGLADKRAIVTVVQTVYANPTPVAAPVAPAAVVAPVAPAAPIAAPTVAAPKSGILGFFDSLFGGSSSKPAAAPAPAPAPAAAPVAAPAASVDTSTSNGLFSTLFSGLSSLFGGSSSAPSAPADAPSAPASPPPSSDPSASSTEDDTPSGSLAVPLAGTPLLGAAHGSSTDTPGWNSVDSSTYPTGSSAGGYNAQYAEGSLGITYSPYQKSGACKSASQVAQDIARLSGYKIIRLYATDCSGIENVLESISSNQQVFLGVWNLDQASVEGGLTDIKKAVEASSKGWNYVHTISIGNERVNDGEATVGDINSALSIARSWLKANVPQYTGYVVTVDTLVAVKSNPGLCTASDYLAVNCHPYWDGGVQPQNSGPWLLEQIQGLKAVCGNSKEILITETGWPSQGKTFGNCVPSKENQQLALQSIVSSLGSKAFAFTMYNDYWKSGGSYDVEQFWGVFGDPPA